jgi:hypothetical protein
MLGIAGVVALVLGAFTAGAGVFDWEFLFSDGYREYAWVRSLGREVARGLLMLLGGVLMIGGFVSQVVDAASKPVLATAALTRQTPESEAGEQDADEQPSPARDAAAPTPLKTDFNSRTSLPPTVVPGTKEKNTASPGRVGADVKQPPPASSPLQAMTIWEPDVAVEDAQTLLFLKYRFEAGHKPVAGGRYYWIVDFLGATHEVVYEAQSLQQQGQLTQVFGTPVEGGGFEHPWSNRVEIDRNGHRTQVSNRLEISSEGVRLVPLSAGQ